VLLRGGIRLGARRRRELMEHSKQRARACEYNPQYAHHNHPPTHTHSLTRNSLTHSLTLNSLTLWARAARAAETVATRDISADIGSATASSTAAMPMASYGCGRGRGGSGFGRVREEGSRGIIV